MSRSDDSPRRAIRVLFVIAGLPAGGAERQLALLVRGLDRSVFDPALLIFNAASKVHYQEIFERPLHFRALGLSGGNPARLLPPILKGTAEMVREFAPDVVYASLNVANHATRLSRLLYRWRPPLVTAIRNSFRIGYSPLEKAAERILWRQSACIVCNADFVRREIIEDLGVPAERLATIPNGVDPRFFDQTPDELPQAWPSGRTALVLGRFTRQKNHLALVTALTALRDRGALADWHIVLAGEGPLEAEIRRFIAVNQLDDKVALFPPVPDPRPLYQASQLLILPSLYEGMSNVAVEAQAAGVPVAVVAAANLSGVVAPAKGFILRGDLAEELAPLFAAPAQELARIGRLARQDVADRYGAQSVISKTQDVLLRIAAANPVLAASLAA